MPVSDECQTEASAAAMAWEIADEFCSSAMEAFQDWVEEAEAVAEECADAIGPPPPEIGPDMDPMLIHELERQWEEHRERIADCVRDSASVADRWNHHLDLMAACEISIEEAEALQEALDACLHALHEGIPFA